MNTGNQVGLIVRSYGRQFIVEVNGINYQAVTKSKKTDYVVGDQVQVSLINQQQLQILDVLPRRNLVYRSDQNRSKIIASNISQLLIVIAVKPNFNINFLNSCLLGAEAEDIEPIILLNKTDLPESANFIPTILDLYQAKLNYSVIQMSALSDCTKLKSYLMNQHSLLIGQSGVGKSTIINTLIPNTNTKVGEITKSENSGCHTTTNATLYHLNVESSIIDCPGLQEFGLYHLQLEYLINLFPELREYYGQCKFRNCSHLNEPGCVIIEAYKTGKIDKSRFAFLQSLTQKLQLKMHY